MLVLSLVLLSFSIPLLGNTDAHGLLCYPLFSHVSNVMIIVLCLMIYPFFLKISPLVYPWSLLILHVLLWKTLWSRIISSTYFAPIISLRWSKNLVYFLHDHLGDSLGLSWTTLLSVHSTFRDWCNWSGDGLIPAINFAIVIQVYGIMNAIVQGCVFLAI